MISIDITGEVISAIIFLLILIPILLTYIAYLLRNFKSGVSERIVERYVSNGQPESKDFVNLNETEEQKRARVQKDIDMENRWKKDNVESNVDGVGNSETVDGKSSLDAVEQLKKLSGDNNKKKSE